MTLKDDRIQPHNDKTGGTLIINYSVGTIDHDVIFDRFVQTIGNHYLHEPGQKLTRY